MQASPDPKQDAVEDRGGDALGVVEGMVGLQPHAHPSLQTDGVAKRRGHGAFLRDQDQILVAHQLETPAAISGVIPRETFASVSPVAASDNSQSRKPPTVSDGNRRKGLRRRGCRGSAG